MGAALIVPVLALVALLVIWFVFFAKRTRDQARHDAALPDEPYARRQEELSQLRDQHELADPERTEHPARRP